jgi:transglutaminase-like putative cysteine protease
VIQYRIAHQTTYSYAEPVSLCQNVAHLKPRDWPRQWCEKSILSITPDPAVLDERIDYFGNPATYFTIQERHTELSINISHRITVRSENPPNPLATTAWPEIRDRLRTDVAPVWLDAYQYAFASRYAPDSKNFGDYAAALFTPDRPILDAVLALNAQIHGDFVYDPRATNIATPVEDVLRTRRGVCQDFAHLMLSCLRSLGLAARYVSGYLCTVPPPGQKRQIGADATHAWVSVFCGDAGWVDFDPTNNSIPSDQHILLAWGRDYDDVSPVKGVILGGGQHRVTVSVDVEPVAKNPEMG